jgi:hypothetical protein
VTVSTEVHRWRKRKTEKGSGLRLREKKALGMLWLLYRAYCWKRKYKLYYTFCKAVVITDCLSRWSILLLASSWGFTRFSLPGCRSPFIECNCIIRVGTLPNSLRDWSSLMWVEKFVSKGRKERMNFAHQKKKIQKNLEQNPISWTQSDWGHNESCSPKVAIPLQKMTQKSETHVYDDPKSEETQVLG